MKKTLLTMLISLSRHSICFMHRAAAMQVSAASVVLNTSRQMSLPPGIN
ncbi:MAG: hypothetical protein V9E88_01215 [Ferruginibacter sp.]